MNIDLQKRYDSADDFFTLDGSIVMKLSTAAAIAVCEQAGKRGMLIARIEGGERGSIMKKSRAGFRRAASDR